MALVTLLLSVCIAATVQRASAQVLRNVTQQNNSIDGCERNEQLLRQLVSAVSRLQRVNDELLETVSQLQTDVTRMQNDTVAPTG